jgi:transglycosylase-like protein with SLT domain
MIRGYRGVDGVRASETGAVVRGDVRRRLRVRSFVTLVFSFVSLTLLVVSEANAEIVFFSTGRTLSIKEHHADPENDEKLVLTLRSGGEIVCEPSIIDRIVEDEVPYPEPEAEQAAIAAAAPLPALPVKYGEIIDRVSAAHNVPATLVRAVIQVESAYHERARSPKGAMGLMQLMPATAKQYAVSDPYDPASNIEAGVKYLKSLLERLPVALALAAYNAGEAAVQRFNGIPPYRETQDYVARILRLAKL